MPREQHFLTSDSSDDDLPPLPGIFNVTVKNRRKKTFDELFRENVDLIASQERHRNNLEQLSNLQIQEGLNDEAPELPSPGNPIAELDDQDEAETFEKPFIRLFGELNHLQFFSLEDLRLPKFGFDSTLNLSELETLLVQLDEDKLHREIKCGSAFSPKYLHQLNPFLQYVLKTMSVHSNVGYVRACQRFIKRICKYSFIKNISISYTDVFTVLFNYGIDVQNLIFSMLPGSSDFKKAETVKDIPKNWQFNLKAVLSSLCDLMEYCQVEEQDLFRIFVCFLWIGMDDGLHVKTVLELAMEIVLFKFSEESWPVWRWEIARFLMSGNALMDNRWYLLIKMINCVPKEICRGVELQNYLSYSALRKIIDGTDSNVIPEYSTQLFSIKSLQPILESISSVKKSLQLMAIRLTEIYTDSLDLTSVEEYDKCLALLKRCEASISKHASLQQSRLCIIYSRISALTPFESMKQMYDIVEEGEKMSDDEESSLRNLEIDRDESQSPLAKQLFSKRATTVCASKNRSLKQNAAFQSFIHDTLAERTMPDDEGSLFDLEIDRNAPPPPLPKQAFSEERRTVIADNASSDTLIKQNATAQKSRYDTLGKEKDTTDDKAASLRHSEIDRDAPPLPKHPFAEPTKTGCASNASRDMLTKQNATAQKSMSPDTINTIKTKCQNFLSTLIRLAGDKTTKTASNVKKLIQNLIDGVIEPEEFSTQVQKELQSNHQPYLIHFLKKSLPHVRQALINGEMTIEGIRPPPMSASLQGLVPTTQIGTLRPILAPNTRGILNSTGGNSALAAQLSQPLSGNTILTQRLISPHVPQSIARPVRPITIVSTAGSSASYSGLVQSSPATVGALQSKIVLPKQVSIIKSTSTPKEKKSFVSVRDEDDINDVAAMGGVNLVEESQRILATNSELIGSQIRSCKDDNHFLSSALHRKVLQIAKKHGLEEVRSEVVDLISHAAEKRLKTIIEKLSILAEHRCENPKNDPRFEVTSDVKAQIKFLEELDRLEKKRHDDQEKEILLKAAKSRSKLEDPELLKLKQKAKEMQRAEIEELRQREANMTALLAIGPRKKFKPDPGAMSIDQAGNGETSGSSNSGPKPPARPRVKRVILRDLLFAMENDSKTIRRPLLYKYYAR